jgi:hypothetical protein
MTPVLVDPRLLIQSLWRGKNEGATDGVSSMNRKVTVLLIAASGTLGLSGCGHPAGLFPVSGKVLFKGEPAAGAVVYFHREGPPPIPASTIPFGIVDEDGSFSLASDGQGDGCPPGKYAVLVEWKARSETPVAQPNPSRVKGKPKVIPVNSRSTRNDVDRLRGRYFDISKPLIHADILPQSNSLTPFELMD